MHEEVDEVMNRLEMLLTTIAERVGALDQELDPQRQAAVRELWTLLGMLRSMLHDVASAAGFLGESG